MGVVEVDDLYGLPLDQFVPERTALSRELRKSGDRDRAGEVAALKKPSVAAWAVNQLVRTQRKGVNELFEAGDALRSAQDDVLAGRGDAGSLRAAVERERTAVDALTGAARGLLSSEGNELSATIIERVGDTLHAAALDEEARAQVSGGRLERELRHVGLGGLGAASPTPTKRSAAKKRVDSGDGKAKKQAAEQERELRERAKARDDARREARATEREARRTAERAERAAKIAQERRDAAAAVLADAEAELEAAQAALAGAQESLQDAEEAVREASQ